MLLSGSSLDLLIVIVVALLALVAGWLAGIMQQRSRNVQLELTARQADERLHQSLAETKNLHEIKRQLEDEHHRLEIDVNILKQKILSAEESEENYINEINKSREDLLDLRRALSRLQETYHDLEKKLEVSRSENRSLTNNLRESQRLTDDLRRKYDDLSSSYHNIKNKHTELTTTLERKEEHFKEQIDHLQSAKTTLKQEFEHISRKIFEENGKNFTRNSQTTMETLLKPFREQISHFQNRINEIHDVALKGNTNLEAEIKNVLAVGLRMNQEARNLTNALKGDSQQRGAWGEAQLHRTLEISGLVENTHYETQTAFRDENGHRKQTDYLIKLPDGKHIIIDSKVSLIAYERATQAETTAEQRLALKQHVDAVRKHIDDLSSKDYTALSGMKSPNFVLMFMPIEPAYISALKEDGNLFEYGYQKGVILVSHTTLIPILRTVSNLWMIERSNSEAHELSEKAGEIYNSVCIIAERLHKLGGTLGTVSKHYNNTVKAFIGQQGLYGKVDRFKKLSLKANKTLSSLEPVHTDFETERLSLIVEPVTETPTEEDTE